MVVGDIKAWFVTFLLHVFEYLVEGLDDGGAGEVYIWDCVDVLCVVIYTT